MVVRGHPGYIPGFLGGFAGPELRVVIQLDLAAQCPCDMNVSTPRQAGEQVQVGRGEHGTSCIAIWRIDQAIKSLGLPVTANIEAHNLLWILCDTLARWLEAVSSTLVEMVTRARKLPGRQEVLPCCGEDVVDIEHWRLGGQHTHR